MLSAEYWRGRQVMVRLALEAVRAEPLRQCGPQWAETLQGYLSWLKKMEMRAGSQTSAAKS